MAACSWISDVVCSSKIGMGMVMDLVMGGVDFSVFLFIVVEGFRGGGDG